MVTSPKIIDLDEAVINALNLLISRGVPKFEMPHFSRPLVVGSGNAAVTGDILFHKKHAIFADESNYLDKIHGENIDGCILISASGGKHSPIIAKEMKKRNIHTVLLTNNPSPIAKDFVETLIVYPKNPEPYTYNTSTYLSMIISMTKEDPKKILAHIEKIKNKIPKNFKKYDSYFIIVPDKFDLVREMYLTKFSELFGSKISGRSFTIEQTEHAKTVIPNNKELFIGLGVENKMFGKNRLNIPLSKDADFGEIISVGYYLIGKIQKQSSPYFKKNIENYCKETSKVFHENIKVIVE
jgi:hypothetical protein